MAAEVALVLENIGLLDFIQFVLDKHTTPSTLVVCCSKDVFLKNLIAAVAKSSPVVDSTNEQNVPTSSRAKLLVKPTLRLLASSRSVRVVFCPELAHLRAYLATHAYRYNSTDVSAPASRQDDKALPLLAVLNSIAVHHPTSAYSAQGISRTLATAVDAAYHIKSQLILAECAFSDAAPPPTDLNVDMDADASAATPPPLNPWDEEVSILNVTTKSFGAGDRGWMGRTVSLRKIAGRWCHFKDVRDMPQ